MKSIGKERYNLDTPCLLIDIDILEENLMKMQAALQKYGKQVRPHAKTHKCSIIAKKQMETGALGICTAKLSEAEVLVKKGLMDILITGPVAGDRKIERLLDILSYKPSLIMVVDCVENAQFLSSALSGNNLSVDVLLDVDPGLGRTGTSYENAVDLAKRVADLPSLRFRGIQAYAGQVQHIASYSERHRTSLECMKKAEEVFLTLKQSGYPCDTFTGGGTGTYDIDVHLKHLTDIQAGSYILMDAEYMGIGSADDPGQFTTFKPALTMLTSVVSNNRNGFVTVDAGLKSLYKDGSQPIVISAKGLEYSYDWFGDEYGKMSFPENTDTPDLGSRFELIVSHCDPTVNQFDRFHIMQKGRVVDIWPIDMRGKSQ